MKHYVVKSADGHSRSRGSKHDADCLRRRDWVGLFYVCTCGTTDADVKKLRAAVKKDDARKEAT